MRVLPAISPHGSQSGRQLMIAIARSRTSNADYSYCTSSVGASSQSRQWQPQLAYRFATPRHHFIPQPTPSRGHDPDVAADCPRLSNPHSSIAPRRSTHAGPRFPPSRLFGRLPPCIPSRLRLAGIRKPLTIPAVRRAVSKRRQAQRGLSLTDDYLPDFPEVTGARASGERSASRSRNSIAAETSMPLPDLSSRTKTGAHHERDLEKLSCRC